MAKGGARPGAGRKPGSPNKNRVDVLQMIQEQFPNYHPVAAMAEIAKDETIDLKLRLDAHKEVSKYCVPQLSRRELVGDEDNPIQHRITEISLVPFDEDDSSSS